ncbi:hypothetical protein ANCCAN_23002 [Ancylostoma caninum]|uniref:Uncharacterized protein n=1 Tax=Ancylostoma caninum TaxID=29170 RepID=A0A368FJQ3_ANCCA|nr:hypothetical protein ANCCAN_23002 [Ancylostoma caninum]
MKVAVAVLLLSCCCFNAKSIKKEPLGSYRTASVVDDISREAKRYKRYGSERRSEYGDDRADHYLDGILDQENRRNIRSEMGRTRDSGDHDSTDDNTKSGRINRLKQLNRGSKPSSSNADYTDYADYNPYYYQDKTEDLADEFYEDEGMPDYTDYADYNPYYYQDKTEDLADEFYEDEGMPDYTDYDADYPLDRNRDQVDRYSSSTKNKKRFDHRDYYAGKVRKMIKRILKSETGRSRDYPDYDATDDSRTSSFIKKLMHPLIRNSRRGFIRNSDSEEEEREEYDGQEERDSAYPDYRDDSDDEEDDDGSQHLTDRIKSVGIAHLMLSKLKMNKEEVESLLSKLKPNFWREMFSKLKMNKEEVESLLSKLKPNFWRELKRNKEKVESVLSNLKSNIWRRLRNRRDANNASNDTVDTVGGRDKVGQLGGAKRKNDLSGIPMCSSFHMAFLGRKEKEGCAGSVAFANVVCSDYFQCSLNRKRPGSECRAKICEKYKATPKKDCFKNLFICD